jgi:hypothetical protein
VCKPADVETLFPLKGVQRCPWPGKADIQQTELVCKKHGRGVEALTISGTTMGAQFCLPCSLAMLSGVLPQLTEAPKELAKPDLTLLEEATEGGMPEMEELPVEDKEAAVSQPAAEDNKPEPEKPEPSTKA